MWKFRLYAAIGDTYFVMQKTSKNWKNIKNWPKQKKTTLIESSATNRSSDVKMGFIWCVCVLHMSIQSGQLIGWNCICDEEKWVWAFVFLPHMINGLIYFVSSMYHPSKCMRIMWATLKYLAVKCRDSTFVTEMNI